jgi:molecular chaperone DnaJ
MQGPDYYKVLGVPRSANADEIKKAYRKLARRYHPDVNSSRDAEDRFKQISEAFDVLSDPMKRQAYDRFGFYSEQAGSGTGARGPTVDFANFGAANFRDIFSEIFNNARGQSAQPRKQASRGSDIEYPLAVEFQQAMQGFDATIDIARRCVCDACGGTGESASGDLVCRGCGGTGQSAWRISAGAKCAQCGGTGRLPAPCAKCKGEATAPRRETLTVRIPPGVETGSRIRVAGKGNAGRLGGPPGDLYVITNVGEHAYFKRQGDNIYCTVPITVPEAALGAKIEVPTIDGKALLRVPPGTQSGQRFRLRERGVPSLRAGIRGDQFVEVKITLPRVISEETKELLARYARYNPENPRAEMGLD